LLAYITKAIDHRMDTVAAVTGIEGARDIIIALDVLSKTHAIGLADIIDGAIISIVTSAVNESTGHHDQFIRLALSFALRGKFGASKGRTTGCIWIVIPGGCVGHAGITSVRHETNQSKNEDIPTYVHDD